MNSDRIKEIQETTAYPESVSVKQALLQVWNECEQEQVKNCNIPLTAVMCRFFHKSIIMNWKRYRLKTYAVSDNRPLIFNPKYPWWCSGYGEDDKGEYSVIIAYLPKDEDLLKYWDDAFDVEFTEEESISFSDRFPKPSYFVS